jgi:hypothetical protein
MVGRALWACATLNALGAEEKGIELADMSQPQLLPAHTSEDSSFAQPSKKRKLSRDAIDEDKSPATKRVNK